MICVIAFSAGLAFLPASASPLRRRLRRWETSPQRSGRSLRVCAICVPGGREELLATVPVEEVWGIGAASAAKLAKLGVSTAADLAALEADDARALMTVTGGRVVCELRGISCYRWSCWSRRGRELPSPGVLETGHILVRDARGHRKLRHSRGGEDVPVQGRGGEPFVFMHTNAFNNDAFYSNGATAHFCRDDK